MAKGILRNLRITRVALVDHGANFDKSTGDGAHVMLFKSAGPSLSSVHVDTAGEEEARKIKEQETNRNKEKRSMAKTWKSLFKSTLGLMGESDVTKRAEGVAALAKLADELPDTDTEVSLHKADDPMCKCATCMEKRVPDDVTKRFTEIEKANEALRKQNETLSTSLNAEIEKRENGDMYAILKGFKHTPINLDTDVAVFVKMKKNDPAAYDRTIALMKATEAQLATTKLFENVGSDRRGAGEGSAWAQLIAKATNLVEKSATKVSKEQALDQVLQDPANFELVKQYRAEQNS